MPGAGRTGAAGAALLVLALGAGCAPASGPAGPVTPAPVRSAWPGCVAVGAFAPERSGPDDVGAVPAGFVPDRAVLCETGERTDAKGSTVGVDLERTATRVGPLLAYLARPSERPSAGACPAVGFVQPWLFLLDASGRFVVPAIPRDGCGLPLGRQDGPAPWTALSYTDRVVRER